MTRAQILVVDDKENMRELLVRLLGPKHNVTTADDGARALAMLSSKNFDVVISDVRMPGADGIEVLRAVKETTPDTEVIMITAYATVDAAVEAIKLGAYDYLEKPFDPDAALRVVERAIERKQLREQAANLRRAVETRYSFHSLIGESEPMQELYDLLQRAAKTDVTVLLSGSSGTGKELAARAVHFESDRATRPFVPVNCGALPGELVESELFGHARGAFTGAATAKAGLFEEARGGTIFLDEISELPAMAQVKLNRALQEHEVRRVGENVATQIDVRIIAATNRDLKSEVERGAFREDLYYRLNVFFIHVPLLNQRGDDVRLLAANFLEKSCSRLGREIEGFEPDALKALLTYDWPGNVRQLENTIERAVAVTAHTQIGRDDLPPDVVGASSSPALMSAVIGLDYKQALSVAREQISRDYLEGLMREYQGNVTQAAEHAGLERESLHRLLKKHGLHSSHFRPERGE